MRNLVISGNMADSVSVQKNNDSLCKFWIFYYINISDVILFKSKIYTQYSGANVIF